MVHPLQTLLKQLTTTLAQDRQRYELWEEKRHSIVADQQTLSDERDALQKTLRLLRVHEATYIFGTEVPLQLTREIQVKEDRIGELKSKIESAEQQLNQPPPVNEARSVLCSEIIAFVKGSGWDVGSRHQLERLSLAYPEAADLQRVWQALESIPVRSTGIRWWIPIGALILVAILTMVVVLITKRPPTEAVALSPDAAGSTSALTTPGTALPATPSALINTPATAQRIGIVGSEAGAGDWSQLTSGQDSTLELTPDEGQTGQALRLSYNLAPDGWVLVSKQAPTGWLVGTDALRFSYRGSGANDTLEIKLLYEERTGSDGKATRLIWGRLWSQATNTADEWVTVVVPYREFGCWPADGCDPGAPIDLVQVNALDFAVSHKQGDQAGVDGVVIIDNVEAIRLDRNLKVGGHGVLLIGPDAQAGSWDEYAIEDGTSTITLAPAHGQSGSALEMAFQLAPSEWVGAAMHLPTGLLAGTDGLQISYKGTGAANTLELKLVCDQTAESPGAVFSYLQYHVTDTQDQWATLIIPYTDFSCWRDTGCALGSQIYPQHIGTIDIAISNKGGDEASVAGVLVVDNLRAVTITN